MSTPRQERARELVQRLRIEVTERGTRYVTLDGVALGRLTRDETTGDWRCEFRDGWHPTPSQLQTDHVEHAEGWAVEQVADMVALDDETRRRLG